MHTNNQQPDRLLARIAYEQQVRDFLAEYARDRGIERTLRDFLGSDGEEGIEEQIEARVDSQVEEARDDLRKEIRADLEREVREEWDEKREAEIRAELRAELEEEIRDELKWEIEHSKRLKERHEDHMAEIAAYRARLRELEPLPTSPAKRRSELATLRNQVARLTEEVARLRGLDTGPLKVAA